MCRSVKWICAARRGARRATLRGSEPDGQEADHGAAGLRVALRRAAFVRCHLGSQLGIGAHGRWPSNDWTADGAVTGRWSSRTCRSNSSSTRGLWRPRCVSCDRAATFIVSRTSWKAHRNEREAGTESGLSRGYWSSSASVRYQCAASPSSVGSPLRSRSPAGRCRSA